MPLVLVAVAVVVAVVLLSQGGGTRAASPAAQPAAAAKSQPAATPTPLPKAAAKQGKPPSTPPPPLSEATLQELNDLLSRIKALRNEAVQKRSGQGDTQGAKATMEQAHKLLEQWQQTVQPQLRWQENAQMEDWAQPAEYVALEKLFGVYQRLNNEVRKGGG